MQRQRPVRPPPPQGIADAGSQLPVAQAMPQPPQWKGLVAMSTSAPPQQRWLGAPACVPFGATPWRHVPAAQLTVTQGLPVGLHAPPPQQGSLLPPQATQRSPLQTAPAPQKSVTQQGCPMAPQGTHRPPEQVVLASQPPPQQGCPLAPQAAQVPPMQVVRLPQAEPAQQG